LRRRREPAEELKYQNLRNHNLSVVEALKALRRVIDDPRGNLQ
jgi:hypothetical protein